MKHDQPQHIGQQAENKACCYLQKQGLKLITRNFRCRYGEIDLIMQDQADIVFVEVRYRSNKNYAQGAESITPAKQQRLTNSAQCYLQRKKLWEKVPCRFDVVAMGEKTSWLKNAIQPYYN